MDPSAIEQRVTEENPDAAVYMVRPMEGRLGRIFEIDEGLATNLCAEFMDPISRIGRVYPETIPVREVLRSRGITTVVVSNSP